MLFRQLQYFISVVETGSFTKAAEQSFISQSAVSQQVAVLEKELGAPLFERTTRQLALTDAGRYLYEHGRRILADAAELKEKVIQAAYHSLDRLTVCYVAGRAPAHLTEALAGLKKQFGELKIDVYETGYRDAFSDLESGRTDVLLVSPRGLLTGEYREYYITEMPCYARLAADAEQAVCTKLTLNDLCSLTCIIPTEEKERATEREYCRDKYGFDYFLYASTIEEARLMVSAGNGFMLTGRNDSLPGTVVLPLYAGDSPLTGKYYLLCRKANTNPYIGTFADILQSLND